MSVLENMEGVPYIMPPIFCNENYSRYRKHNNTVKWSKISATYNYFST
jgi:hypothetical protein